MKFARIKTGAMEHDAKLLMKNTKDLQKKATELNLLKEKLNSG